MAKGTSSGTVVGMCWERFTIDAAPGSTVTNTRARTGAILSIDDPRLDDVSDPAIRRRRRVLAVVGKRLPATTRHIGYEAPFDQGRFLDIKVVGGADGRDTCTDVNGWIMTTALRANGPYAGKGPLNPA